MDNKKIKNSDLKRRIISVSYKYKLSHLGSCLTAVDIIDDIYKKKKPSEKFILSSGHAHLAHLVVMEKYREGQIDIPSEFLLARYGIHCDRKAGCDVSTGSLGNGLPISVGMALADRSKNVYCLISDGECSEGSIWEAMRIKDEQNLTNLKVYLNWNGYGGYKETNYCLPIGGIVNPKMDSIPNNDKGIYFPNNIDSVALTGDALPEFLEGQKAHYALMTEEDYKVAMEWLR